MKVDKQKVLSIIEMRKKNQSNEHIAEKLGISAVSVARWMKRLREAGHDVPKRAVGMKKLEL